jgi:glucokinase
MKRQADDASVLAGDIGGTKTNLAVFGQGKARPETLYQQTYPSREFASLEAIIERFLDSYPDPIDAACFGIAGPVADGCSKTTNLPWTVSERSLRDRFHWSRVRLLNDVAVTARGIPSLQPGETVRLNEPDPRPGAPIGLVAPGTGLGQALLVFADHRPVPLASEGGHADFAPGTEEEVRLWRFLLQQHGHVSLERVISGPGLEAIYRFLKQDGGFEEPGWLRDRLTQSDPPKVISEIGLQDGHPLCVTALDMFCRMLANTCGNLALTGLTRGGLYLGGGIPPKILPKLRQGAFLEAFCNKGRFSDLLRSIPLLVIINDRTALLGAAQEALSL